jgi:hypothetical protein
MKESAMGGTYITHEGTVELRVSHRIISQYIIPRGRDCTSTRRLKDNLN